MGMRTIFSGVCFGDLLDVHAARLAGHHHDTSGSPVDDHSDVQFAVDLKGLLDEYGTNWHSLGAGLVGDEGPANQLTRNFGGLFGSRDELDAARLATSTSVDLRLDDDAAV